ncbi:hypothetical protein [Streptomyces sp. SID2888]|uniref:hypothetical protein n=1 Tax=Streptomyces sp. SID2888 TaxID=2690256 RepID=UPI0019285458|nr:hypothetical protein [Streptomyces sp. SID2888]
MPTFHRQPEWQQPADRHTQLVDPVLTVRQLSRFDFNLRSLVRIDHALVFSTPKGSFEAYLPPRRPTRAEVVANRYTAVYEVDMGVHPWTAELTLPSDNDAFEFTAEVDLSWQVLDPARFVASGHRDVPGLLLGELQQAARPVTRRFAIADSAATERELLQAVTVLGPLGAPAGLQVTWTLRLRRDQANIEHQQRLQAIDHSAAEQVRVAQRGMEVDVEADRRQRQQDALQVGRAMVYGTQQQELLLQQQRWQHEQALLHSGQQHQLALQHGQQQLELQQIEAQKIDFYQWHLQQGGVHSWALHLAQHPEDSQLVMTSMREDQLRMIQAQMDLVKQLLSGDAAENYELEGPKQLALRTVSDILNQRLPGVPQGPPLLPGGTGPAYPGAVADATGQVEAGRTDAGRGDAPPDGAAPMPPPGPPATGPAPVPGTPPPPPPPTVPPAAAGPYGPPATGPYTPPGPPAGPYTPPGPPPFTPPPPTTAAPYGAAGVFPPPPATAYVPPQTGWQPPPGYGTTPNAPERPDAAPPEQSPGTPVERAADATEETGGDDGRSST